MLIRGQARFQAAAFSELPARQGLLFAELMRLQGEGAPFNYDNTPDGARFVMVMESSTSRFELRVVLNWLEELKRLTRAGATQ